MAKSQIKYTKPDASVSEQLKVFLGTRGNLVKVVYATRLNQNTIKRVRDGLDVELETLRVITRFLVKVQQ